MSYYSNSNDILVGMISAATATSSIIVGLILAVLYIAALWMLFSRAGVPGWSAIIPLLNSYMLFKITWGSGWLFLLMLIPVVNLIIYLITMYKLSEAFGHGFPFALGLIFLGPIFLLILGFGHDAYVGPNR